MNLRKVGIRRLSSVHNLREGLSLFFCSPIASTCTLVVSSHSLFPLRNGLSPSPLDFPLPCRIKARNMSSAHCMEGPWPLSVIEFLWKGKKIFSFPRLRGSRFAWTCDSPAQFFFDLGLGTFLPLFPYPLISSLFSCVSPMPSCFEPEEYSPSPILFFSRTQRRPTPVENFLFTADFFRPRRSSSFFRRIFFPSSLLATLF